MIYTVWSDYSATGEGLCMCVLVTNATDAEQAKERFREKAGAFYARFAVVEEGVADKPLVRKLLPEWVLALVQKDTPPACTFYGEFYFNYS